MAGKVTGRNGMANEPDYRNWDETKLHIRAEIERGRTNLHELRGEMQARISELHDKVGRNAEAIHHRLEPQIDEARDHADTALLQLASIKAYVALWGTIFGIAAGTVSAWFVAYVTRR